MNEQKNDSPYLTFEDMMRAVKDSDERVRRNRQELARNTIAFIDSVPPRLRSHPLVQQMGWYVATGIPLHPKDHDEMMGRYRDLLKEET